jgi:hypothetical protein
MRKTGSTILAAGLHGMFNAFAGIFTLLIVNGSPLIDGAIGLVSIFSMVIVGFLFYVYRRIRKNS